MKSRIAYIDDNTSNLDFIKLAFNSNFDVDTYQKYESFMGDLGTNQTYAAIMLDVHMPDIDGFALYERIIIHPSYNGCPILFISGDDSDAVRIKSFSLGAVDFLNRQMTPTEMIARLNSKIQYFKKLKNIIEFGNMRINFTTLKCFVNSKEVPLTFIEFKLLCHLIINYPEVMNKDHITEYVWGSGKVLDATIYTHLSNLNGKLTEWDYELTGVKFKGFKVIKRQPEV